MHLTIDTPTFAVTVICTCLSRGDVHVTSCLIYCSVTEETVHEVKCSPGPVIEAIMQCTWTLCQLGTYDITDVRRVGIDSFRKRLSGDKYDCQALLYIHPPDVCDVL